MASLSRKLFPSESKSHLDQLHTQNSCEKSVLVDLKENIQNQEKERMKNKYERTIKNKENQQQQITRKCESLESVVKKITKANESLIEKIEKMEEKAMSDQKLIQTYEVKMKTSEKEKKKIQEDVATMTKELKKALAQIVSEKQKNEKMAKEHKIAMRRQTAQYEQTKLKLQSKLTIKQKQQQKVETMLQQKKQELREAITEKDEEIANLKKAFNNIKTSYQHLTKQYEQSQQEKIIEYQQFQIQVDQIKMQNELQKNINLEFIETIKQAMQKFKQMLALQSQDEDIISKIGKFAEELKQRQSPDQYKKTIEKLTLQLSNSKQNEKDLTNKLQILEDQLNFLRTQANKNEEFSAILKAQMNKIEVNEHLVLKERTRNIVEKTQSKLAEVQKNMNFHQQQKKLNKTMKKPQHNFPSLSLKNLNTSQLPLSTPLKRSAKPINEYLHQQLQSKKKSLIYLMYRQQQSNQSKLQPKESQQTSNTMLPTRKRSSSLCHLISTRCRQQLT